MLPDPICRFLGPSHFVEEGRNAQNHSHARLGGKKLWPSVTS